MHKAPGPAAIRWALACDDGAVAEVSCESQWTAVLLQSCWGYSGLWENSGLNQSSGLKQSRAESLHCRSLTLQLAGRQQNGKHKLLSC